MSAELKELLERACNIKAEPEFVHSGYSYTLVATLKMEDWGLVAHVLNELNAENKNES